jgi:cell division protein FtsX
MRRWYTRTRYLVDRMVAGTIGVFIGMVIASLLLVTR